MSKANNPTGGRRPNYGYAIISVSMVLFLLGFFGLVLLQAAQLSRSLKEGIDLIVELAETSGPADREAATQQLQRTPGVRPATIEFISREQALRDMSEEMGEDLLKLDLPNPLFDVLTFNVRAAYLQEDSLAAIQAQLRPLAGVVDVYYQENLIEKIAGNVRRLGWIALAAGIVFLAVAVFLIHATIRLALHANRFLIKTQELVGATWQFISRPYLRRAWRHGVVSGLIAVTALFGTLVWLQNQAPELELFRYPLWTAGLFLALILLGILLNYFSTYYVVRKYLRLRVDELY